MTDLEFNRLWEYYEMAHSEDPNERCYAALEYEHLEELKYDECWLVRHIANRQLLLIQLREKTGYSPNYPGEYPYLDISDAAYALYKLDWINSNATYNSCAENIRGWALMMEERLFLDNHTGAFNYFMVKGVFDEESMLSYEEFVGIEQPGNVGLYHNKAYIERLFNHNEYLLELYDANINDDYSKRHSVDILLQAARKESEEAYECECEDAEYELESL